MAGEHNSQVSFSWEDLPDDCWQAIFYRLDVEEIEPLTLVCKRFLAITNRTYTSFTFPNPKSTPTTVAPLIYSRFPNITRVELDKLHPYIGRFLEDLAASSLPLKDLSLSHQSHFPRKAMCSLGRRMHKTLRSLTFDRCPRMTQNDHFVIANYFSYLSHLNLAKSCRLTQKSMITDDILKAISTKLISLVSLAVTCPYNGDTPSGQSFQYLSSRSPLLSDLDVYFPGTFPGELLWFVSFKSLTSLNLHYVNICDTALVYLSRANLKLLSLTLVSRFRNCYVNGSLMCGFLKSLSFLTELFLYGYNFCSHPIEFDFAASLPNCIQDVTLEKCKHLPNTTIIDLLKSHPKLQFLTLELDNSVPIDDSLFHLPVHQGLNILSLSGTVSDKLVKLICSSCPMLKYFTISDSHLVTKQGIEEIIAGGSNLNRFSVYDVWDSLEFSLYRDKPPCMDHISDDE